jgi:hypothetical protein
MSRQRAAIAAFIGVIGGALAGSPYLDDTGACVAAGGTGFQCAMNEAIGPFISALAIGFCVAILVAHVVTVMSRRALGPSAPGTPSTRAATDVDDACLEIASWGRAPGERAPALAPATPAPEAPRDGTLGSRGRPVPTPRRG